MLGPINLQEAGAIGVDGYDLNDNGPYVMDIDWVIVGGESGPSARPIHPQWIRDLRDQCIPQDVAFFFKQWGEFVSVSEVEGPGEHHVFPDGARVRRTGKKLAGRMIDGHSYNQFPQQLREEEF